MATKTKSINSALSGNSSGSPYNKALGKIVTNPTRTAKGNTTCNECIMAKKNGTPLPPSHPSCRCKYVVGKMTVPVKTKYS